jgi:hypothetical protein
VVVVVVVVAVVDIGLMFGSSGGEGKGREFSSANEPNAGRELMLKSLMLCQSL